MGAIVSLKWLRTVIVKGIVGAYMLCHTFVAQPKALEAELFLLLHPRMPHPAIVVNMGWYPANVEFFSRVFVPFPKPLRIAVGEYVLVVSNNAHLPTIPAAAHANKIVGTVKMAVLEQQLAHNITALLQQQMIKKAT